MELTDTIAMLKLVCRGAHDGYLMIGAIGPEKARGVVSTAFDTTQIEEAARYAVDLARAQNVYVETSLQRCRPAPGRRGVADGVSHTAVVSLDFDGSWGKHKETRLPKHPDDLPELLNAAGVPDPSMVLNTGGGLLALWGLHEPLTIATSDDLAEAQRLAQGFQAHIRRTATERFDWRIDSTADLVRLLRVPDTLNHKFEVPRKVEVVGRSANLLSRTDLVKFASAPGPKRPKPSSSSSCSTEAPQPDGPADWAAITAGCAWVRDCLTRFDALPEPRWYAICQLLASCRDGRSIFHELSAQDSRYDEAETDRKFNRGKDASPPPTCKRIHDEFGFAGCRRCAFWRAV